jgi:hypothetical protein
MSNMNEGAKTDKTMTASGREPSACTKLAFTKNPTRGVARKQFWHGMNERDETDPVSHRPVGRGLTEGFQMGNNNYDGGDVYEW